MNIKHKVCINVARPDGVNINVVRGGQKTIRSRLLDFLFGEKVGVFVLTPGRTVETVEIREVARGGDADG